MAELDKQSAIAAKNATGAEEGHQDWTKHAPPGGIEINGKYYGGGKFIPNEELEKASPEEIAELQRRSELSERLGSKEAKKVLDQEKVARQAGPLTGDTSNLDAEPSENIYLIDDGKVYGGKFGQLVLKRDSSQQGTKLAPEELVLLNSLKTTRFDIVVVAQKKVLSITTQGEWPINDADGANALQALADNTQEIPLEEYTLLNNLTPQTKEFFTGEKNDNRQSPQAIATPVTMSLFRMNLKDNENWEVEDEVGKRYVLKLADEVEKKTIILIHNIYNYFGIPTEKIFEHPEGILTQLKPAMTDIAPKDAEKVIKGFPLDKLFDLDTEIFEEDGKPVRGNIKKKKKKKKSKIGKFPVEESKKIKQTITPEFIDGLLNKVNYPEDERSNILGEILEGLAEDVQQDK